MQETERKYLKKIYDDCTRLEKQKQLTEYGKGQKDLSAIMLKKTNMNFIRNFNT